MLAWAAVLSLAAAFGSAPAWAAPVVHTQAGDVEGVVKSAGVESFLGVPFAAPPVGELRWRP
ncbi:MAG TPA: carboxylesterase family protein, partial [Caulobacteraceae bacterium]